MQTTSRRTQQHRRPAAESEAATALRQRRVSRLALALAIGLLLYFAYLLAFSGHIRSDDELYIIDAVDTIAVREAPYLNETTYLRGLQTVDVEPAQPLLSTPLYWLAYRIPWVGNVHALLLFNSIITALMAVVLFFYALDLGYHERTAAVGTLLFGLTTIALPYARTLFREPLTTLSLLAAAFLLRRWRCTFTAGEKRHRIWLVLGVAVTLLALLSKEAALLALPALVALAFPGAKRLKIGRWGLIGIAAGLLAVVLTMLLLFYQSQWVAIPGRFEFITRLFAFRRGLPHAWYGAAGYLVSPGKSIWMFSPILILALGAPFVLPRARWRESWLPLGLMLLFALSYGAIRRRMWYGGADWGSRYMVPLTPFLMIAALPLIDRMLNSARLWPRIVLAVLGLWGLAVQIDGVYVNVHRYYTYMQAMTGQAPWHRLGIWSIRWSQVVGSLLYAPQADPDIIWLVPAPDWWAIGVILLGIGAAIGLFVWARRSEAPAARPALIGMALSPLLAAAVSLFALWRAYDDPLYAEYSDVLHQMRAHLSEHAGPDDTIMLSTPAYVSYFMNYFKGEQPWYSLPLSPGERYSLEQEPEIVSDRVEELIAPEARSLINAAKPRRLLYNGQPVWLVVDHSSFVVWATRPAEWYMTKYSFPVSAVDFSPRARLVQFLPLAPPTTVKTAYPVGVRLGESIHLIGYDLVVDEAQTSLNDLHPGDMLGISLLWEGIAPMDVDYTMAVYVIDAGGQVILQQDRQPVGGFKPTTAWEPGELIRDNFGFIIPADLPPGEYQLGTAVYSWPSLERLPVTGPDGADEGDFVTLGTIEIRP